MLTYLELTVIPLLLPLSYGIFAGVQLYLSRRSFIKAHGCKEPRCRVPLKDPFLAVDFVWKTLRNAKKDRYLEGTQERFNQYGTTFAAKHMHYPTIHTIEPSNIKQVLATGFQDFKLSSFRVDAMVPLFGRGIFTTDGRRWSHSRALLRPSFARHNMENHLPFMESHFEQMMKAIPTDGSTVDLQRLFFAFTMDTATEFLFGHSVHTLHQMQLSNNIIPSASDTSDAEFVDSYTHSCINIVHDIRLGALSKLHYNPEAKKAQQRTFAYIDRFVDEALALRKSTKSSESEENSQYIFLNELAKETEDREELRDQILNVLLAGRDTTASLLSNMFWEFARHPEIYVKLREEVAAFGGREPTYEELKNMKYLKYCLNESLRLRPVVPANTREAIRDTILPLGGGEDGQSPMFVKKGTHVYYSVYAMHRREEFFGEKTEEYRPERWEGLKLGWEFLPFNGGPRICLGQQFALTEASYLTVRMVQEFPHIEAQDPRPWTELYTMVVYSKYGTLVSLRPTSS
ncbi:cytochrome P450 alkane hydroxylase-like protein [Hyaloscypha bicolor E]|uniref:Cytochrome P450 alkane hydroxylase-like protein n=1 Tax=Hyaloscypha bicolor E TaxID=1095630 RepID=A0A2J6TAR7_9HELO|nr:cytochrome P450 alkane hydroxylase-like protein [Hyaloscypha bicolor E]PMD60119.1 cytochrome P450 alkane hydroxylase-like protein [Hyaloscypha bicolor E]